MAPRLSRPRAPRLRWMKELIITRPTPPCAAPGWSRRGERDRHRPVAAGATVVTDWSDWSDADSLMLWTASVSRRPVGAARVVARSGPAAATGVPAQHGPREERP